MAGEEQGDGGSLGQAKVPLFVPDEVRELRNCDGGAATECRGRWPGVGQRGTAKSATACPIKKYPAIGPSHVSASRRTIFVHLLSEGDYFIVKFFPSLCKA